MLTKRIYRFRIFANMERQLSLRKTVMRAGLFLLRPAEFSIHAIKRII